MTDSENMFDAGKIGCFCDSIVHSTENRRGTETKIVVLGLRVDPLSTQLASALDQRVRNTLFRVDDTTPQAHLKRADFALGVLRQNLHIFATPETEKATRMLSQVQITGVAAKVHKDRNEFSLTFKASFGPADKHELEFIEDWRNNQKFIRFERSEPGLFEDIDEDDEVDAKPVSRPAPMWDDGDEVQPAAAAAAPAPESDEAREKGSRPTAKRGTRKRAGKHDPDGEFSKQRQAGRAKAGGRGKGKAAKPTGAAEATH